ncbi:predicted protein [Histoplasma mississippiense (nom. inval.)]|uniref:predicted protein n=1 Tax=Ajellomyces capsulatus (strain NAm1 / WU24) TaxID=2059318 RepID=UPI000157CFFB|nr:predicted protein [Histoplasma mississippiense (nom. inval.)]EDN11435.1 predicted protein [Histoplasma mississippiense (nom. inval.)]
MLKYTQEIALRISGALLDFINNGCDGESAAGNGAARPIRSSAVHVWSSADRCGLALPRSGMVPTQCPLRLSDVISHGYI